MVNVVNIPYMAPQGMVIYNYNFTGMILQVTQLARQTCRRRCQQKIYLEMVVREPFLHRFHGVYVYIYLLYT